MSRPTLAPGLRVLRRSREEWQVGLRPEHRVLLPDTEAVRRTLGHLVRGEAVPDDADCRAVLTTLTPVTVDASALVAPDVAAGDIAAVALLDPPGYPQRLDARRRALVLVRGALGGTADPRPLLTAAGLAVGDDPDLRPGAVALVLCPGEIDRDRLDDLVRHGVPHLVVRLVEGIALVGPFVDPGRTACLRCIDAHAQLEDPHAPVLTARHARAGDDRRDGVPEPVDSALAALAIAWAVRDLVTHVEGDRPSTWSSTVELGPTLAGVTQTEWLRHPACGCGWLHDEGVSRTMSV